MNNGYIKLFRKFKDWYGYKSATRKSLLIELLLRATHKSHSTIFNGKPLTLNPGQLVVGRKILAESIDLSESWIEKLLKEFEKTGILEQQKTNTSRLITILAWNEYQSSDNGEDNGEDNKKTTKRQQKDTIQECKEYKNEKKEAAPQPAFSKKFIYVFCETYFKYTNIKYLIQPKERKLVNEICSKHNEKELQDKIQRFADMCITGDRWFAKDWSEFTISNMYNKWNNIIPE